MSNRFEHLKNSRQQTPATLDKFIEGANKTPNAKVAKKRPSKEELLLSISGRIDRESECGKPTLVYIKNDINNDIDRYCHGSRQAIINYLLRKGLEVLKEKNELIIETE